MYMFHAMMILSDYFLPLSTVLITKDTIMILASEAKSILLLINVKRL